MKESPEEKADRQRQEDWHERNEDRVTTTKRHKEHMDKLNAIINLLDGMNVY